MYHIISKIHAWLGLLVSIFVMLISLSGIFLVYRENFITATLPKTTLVLTIEPSAAIAKIIDNHKVRQIKSLMLPSAELKFYKLRDATGIKYYDISGNLIEASKENSRFDEWAFQLHHYLLLGKEGETPVGIIGCLCILMALSGFYLWLRAYRQFEFRLLPKSLKRRDLISHHRNLGIVFIIPILFIAFSGSAMIFDDIAKNIISAFTFEKPTESKPPKAPSFTSNKDTILNGMELANNQFQGAQLRYIIFPQKLDAPIVYRFKQNSELHANGRTILYYSPKQSKIIGIIDAQKLDKTTRIYNAFYPLHSARMDNIIYKSIITLSGIVLVFLSGLSAYSYWKKIFNSRKLAKE